MILKPPSCEGCPARGFSSHYVPDEVRENASVVIVGQNPGAEEEAQGKPFIGATGKILESKYLKAGGLTREQVSLCNVIRCRWKGSNDLPKITETITREAIHHCQAAHMRARGSVVVAQGQYALYGLTGESDVDSWRGYALQFGGTSHLSSVWVPNPGQVAVLATVHIARLFRNPTLTLATLSDYAKIARILRGTWPKKPPEFKYGPVETWPARFTFDTEFYRTETGKHMERYSLSTGAQTRVVERADHRPVKLDGHPTVISQYAPADMDILGDLTGGDPFSLFTVDDSVWKHAALYSDHPHDLNYLGSIYSSMNRWKHLADTDPSLYAGCDAYGLWEVDQKLESEFQRDPISRRVYEEIDRPVLQNFVESQYRGLRVDPARVQEVISALEAEKRDASRRAIAVAGWPINLGSSQQVGARLWEVEKLKRRKA